MAKYSNSKAREEKNKYGMISTNFDTRTELSHIVPNGRVYGLIFSRLKNKKYMTAKEFIYSRSQELAEAIDNGYDLRLSEPDILYWMEKYAEYKAKKLPIHNVSDCDCSGTPKSTFQLCTGEICCCKCEKELS